MTPEVLVTVIPGDGIGPEITEAILPLLERVTFNRLAWEIVSAEDMADLGTHAGALKRVVASIKRNRVAIKGPIMTPTGDGFRSVNVRLREELELYACVRPVRTVPGVRSRYDHVDLVVIRENTEDLYAGVEAFVQQTVTGGAIDTGAYRVISPALAELVTGRQFTSDAAIGFKIITPQGTARIIEYAFKYALAHGRKRITCVHKANIQKATDGLFLSIFRDAAQICPTIVADECIVDNACQQLVLRPERFDVIVTQNLYGDILSDLAAGLIGGLGVAPGANIGKQYALFEAVHGTAPDIAGKGVANPTAMLLSAVMMLDHLDATDTAAPPYRFATCARRLRLAIERVIGSGAMVTPDIWQDHHREHTHAKPRSATTREMVEAIRRSHDAMLEIEGI